MPYSKQPMAGLLPVRGQKNGEEESEQWRLVGTPLFAVASLSFSSVAVAVAAAARSRPARRLQAANGRARGREKGRRRREEKERANEEEEEQEQERLIGNACRTYVRLRTALAARRANPHTLDTSFLTADGRDAAVASLGSNNTLY